MTRAVGQDIVDIVVDYSVCFSAFASAFFFCPGEEIFSSWLDGLYVGYNQLCYSLQLSCFDMPVKNEMVENL